MKKLFPHLYARLFPKYSKWKLIGLYADANTNAIMSVQTRVNIDTGLIKFKRSRFIAATGATFTKEDVLNTIYESF